MDSRCITLAKETKRICYRNRVIGCDCIYLPTCYASLGIKTNSNLSNCGSKMRHTPKNRRISTEVRRFYFLLLHYSLFTNLRVDFWRSNRKEGIVNKLGRDTSTRL